MDHTCIYQGKSLSITEFNNFTLAEIFAYPSLITASKFDKLAIAGGNLLQNNAISHQDYHLSPLELNFKDIHIFKL